MKKTIYRILIIVLTFSFTLNCCGCNYRKDENVQEFYSEDTFKTIIIGISTYQDVCKIAPPKATYATSYGAVCEYPVQDGTFIKIQFTGPQLIVYSIDTVKKTEDGSLS